MVAHQLQLASQVAARVAEVRLATAARHVVAALDALDVELAPGTFLSVPRAVSGVCGASPLLQEKVALLELLARDALVLGRVTHETPNEAAAGALYLQAALLGGRSQGGLGDLRSGDREPGGDLVTRSQLVSRSYPK